MTLTDRHVVTHDNDIQLSYHTPCSCATCCHQHHSNLWVWSRREWRWVCKWCDIISDIVSAAPLTFLFNDRVLQGWSHHGQSVTRVHVMSLSHEAAVHHTQVQHCLGNSWWVQVCLICVVVWTNMCYLHASMRCMCGCMCGCTCGWVNTLDTPNSLYHHLSPRDAQNSVIEQRTQTHSCTVLWVLLKHCQLNPKPNTHAWSSSLAGQTIRVTTQ